jgi:antitoxin CptB
MDTDDKKVRWKLRRGMLELDTMLSNFFEHKYAALSDSEKANFDLLLSYEDDYLFRLLMGHEEAHDERVKPIIQVIVQAMQT